RLATTRCYWPSTMASVLPTSTASKFAASPSRKHSIDMKADRSVAVAALLIVAALPLSPQVRHTMFPPVRGTHEMVGAANNLEVEAGFRILTQGGNAIDAGVATVLAAAV